jgi:FXSXX-COOH protein
MGEPDSCSESSICDVTRIPLSQLRTVEDSVLEESVGRLLRPCQGIGDRRWDSPQRILD